MSLIWFRVGSSEYELIANTNLSQIVLVSVWSQTQLLDLQVFGVRLDLQDECESDWTFKMNASQTGLARQTWFKLMLVVFWVTQLSLYNRYKKRKTLSLLYICISWNLVYLLFKLLLFRFRTCQLPTFQPLLSYVPSGVH